MTKIFSIPRINSLGLNGPEKTPQILLQKKKYIQIKSDNENITEDEKEIYNVIKKEIASNDKILLIGGDHSITYPAGKAFLQKYKNKSFLIIFDAHTDCMPPMKEPTHEEFLAGLIKQGWPTKNILIIGLRKIEPEEQKFLDKHKIKYVSHYYNNTITQIKKLTINKKIYLSIDIDAIDPKYAPAVNYPEPNGLTKKTFFKLIKTINKNQVPIIIDIVEIVPDKDKKNKTIKLAKKLIKILTN